MTSSATSQGWQRRGAACISVQHRTPPEVWRSGDLAKKSEWPAPFRVGGFRVWGSVFWSRFSRKTPPYKNPTGAPLSVRDPISIRKRDPPEISIRFRSETKFRSDFDPISIRFRSDFEIPLKNRSENEIPSDFRSDFDPKTRSPPKIDPISIRFRDPPPKWIRFPNPPQKIPREAQDTGRGRVVCSAPGRATKPGLRQLWRDVGVGVGSPILLFWPARPKPDPHCSEGPRNWALRPPGLCVANRSIRKLEPVNPHTKRLGSLNGSR